LNHQRRKINHKIKFKKKNLWLCKRKFDLKKTEVGYKKKCVNINIRQFDCTPYTQKKINSLLILKSWSFNVVVSWWRIFYFFFFLSKIESSLWSDWECSSASFSVISISLACHYRFPQLTLSLTQTQFLHLYLSLYISHYDDKRKRCLLVIWEK
jgi:hypothetical protein